MDILKFYVISIIASTLITWLTLGIVMYRTYKYAAFLGLSKKSSGMSINATIYAIKIQILLFIPFINIIMALCILFGSSKLYEVLIHNIYMAKVKTDNENKDAVE